MIIGEDVTSIGNYAFISCSPQTFFTIPKSVTSIGNNAFSQSTTFSVIVSDIAAWCGISFGDNLGLFILHSDKNTVIRDLVIPEGVTSISNKAFYRCSYLTSVEIPNSVTSIGSSAFYGCSSLTSVTIPNNVTSIGEGAFYCCSGLTSVVVETGNTIYDSRNNCNAIIETASNTLITGSNNTVIPNSVTSIGNYAFYGCSGLASVDIPNGVTSIGEKAFSGCSGITTIDIPNSVTAIGRNAFDGCFGLTSFRFPNKLETIAYNVLANCHVTSILIPGSVKSIEQGAFVSCQNLQDVYCFANDVPTTNNLTFYNLNTSNVTLHVYSESVSAYSSAYVWKTLKQVVALTPEEILAYDPTAKVKVGDLYYYINFDNNTATVTKQDWVFERYNRTYKGDILGSSQE